MRIYPDPELPDVEVEWFVEGECVSDDDRVVATLSTIDPAEEVGTATASCKEGRVRFEDVERVRYRVVAKLEDTTGAALGGYEEEVDLRAGINKRIFSFFGRSPLSNFRVRWTFDMGASCEALSADSVVLLAKMVGGGPFFFFNAPCSAPLLSDIIFAGGMFTITARAMAGDDMVAASPDSAPFLVTHEGIVDVGTLTLSPCTECPPLEPE